MSDKDKTEMRYGDLVNKKDNVITLGVQQIFKGGTVYKMGPPLECNSDEEVKKYVKKRNQQQIEISQKNIARKARNIHEQRTFSNINKRTREIQESIKNGDMRFETYKLSVEDQKLAAQMRKDIKKLPYIPSKHLFNDNK